MLGCTCPSTKVGGLAGYDTEGNYIPDDPSLDNLPITSNPLPLPFPSGGGGVSTIPPWAFPQNVGMPGAPGSSQVGNAIASAFGAGVRVFESIFTPKPTYAQTTSPHGSSTVVWGSGATPAGLTLNPVGGLSITTIALIAVAGIVAFSAFGHKGK